MAYFSNGTEGEMYEEQWCSRCIHRDDPCAVWEAHLLYNYEYCNKKDSVLDLLIPSKGIENGECRMFREKKPDPQTQLFGGEMPNAT